MLCGLDLNALELDAVIELVEFDALEHAEEVEVPVGAAEFAVGRELEADLFLLPNDLFDLAVLDVSQLLGANCPFFTLCARILQRLAA